MKRKMLTKQKLIEMNPWEIFVDGSTQDNPEGINIWNTGKPIYFVAVRGDGFHDWAVYMRGHWNDYLPLHAPLIANQWDKCPKRYIKNIIDCDDEALELYRD